MMPELIPGKRMRIAPICKFLDLFLTVGTRLHRRLMSRSSLYQPLPNNSSNQSISQFLNEKRFG